MLFGKGASTEDIPSQKLIDTLNESFDRKLSGLESRAYGISNGIARSRSAFISASARFRELEKEPDMEYVRASSAAFVEGHKEAYLNLLDRILLTHPIEKHGGTIYESYRSLMYDAETLLNEILRANASFKMVLDAYPGDLNEFKRAFSSLEANLRSLRAELDSRDGDAREYGRLQSSIKALLACDDELGSMQTSLVDLGSRDPVTADAREIPKLEAKVAELRGSVDAADNGITKLNAEMSVILSAIDKPARKHDYISLYKSKLAPLLDSPKLLEQDEKYNDFYKQVGEIRTEIEKGAISVKSADHVNWAIKLITDGRIKELIEGIRERRSSKVPIEHELRDIERTLNELRDVASGASKAETAMREIKERSERLAVERGNTKAEIERMFVEYYKRRIRVV